MIITTSFYRPKDKNSPHGRFMAVDFVPEMSRTSVWNDHPGESRIHYYACYVALSELIGEHGTILIKHPDTVANYNNQPVSCLHIHFSLEGFGRGWEYGVFSSDECHFTKAELMGKSKFESALKKVAIHHLSGNEKKFNEIKAEYKKHLYEKILRDTWGYEKERNNFIKIFHSFVSASEYNKIYPPGIIDDTKEAFSMVSSIPFLVIVLIVIVILFLSNP
jgi:hypothetical protein